MFCFILFLTTTFAFQCINDVGKPVDSWIILKKPKGTTYFFYDSLEKDFKTSPYSLNDSSSGALAHTSKQLWHQDANYVIYNDQVPKLYNIINDTIINNTVLGQFGHTKGFFAFDDVSDDVSDDNSNGFWLTHSIPLFPLGPQSSNTYLGLGSNAKTYAQHLLCLSVSAKTLDTLAGAFLLNRPQIYDSKLLTTNSYENIRNLIDGEFSTGDSCLITPLLSQGGMPFHVYSKTSEWNNDLYAGCVAPYEKDTLWVETWIRGKAEGPVCPITAYDTLDIKSLNFAPLDGQWLETQDHSKWLITETNKRVCMGDINRMMTQYARGGGTTCFLDDILHTVLKKAITAIDECD